MAKEEYSHKDFSVLTLDVSVQERVVQFQKYIDQLKRNNHQIYYIEAQGPVKPRMRICDKNGKVKEVISFVANDYLGMSHQPEVIEAGIEAIKKYGVGVCAAPCIGGYLDLHRELEQEIAAFTGHEDAMLFSSGFGANSGSLSCLLGKHDLAIVDTGIHTSVFDGLKQTNVKLIPHNNIEYLELVLKREQPNYKTRMVIVDGVYSQDGDLCPLPEILELCRKYNALLMVDDAHGIGVVGKTGRGVAEHYHLLGEADLTTGTFSKAFGNVGGFVASSRKMIQYLKYYANTTVFSAAIIPQVTASVYKALELIKTHPEFVQKLWENTRYAKEQLVAQGFEIGATQSPIIPFMIRDDYKVKQVTTLLQEEFNLYTIGIVNPAVRSKEARIRITLTAAHEKEEIDLLVDAFCQIDRQLELKKKI